MACYSPIQAYQRSDGSICFAERKGDDIVRSLQLPCQQCVGCRLERSRQWAVRCMHEASLYKRNCFITLTYDDTHIPSDGSLRYRDFQLFMKRLRKEVPGVRFYMCGEYGDKFRRPHYHACLFNCDFDDKRPIRLLGKSRLYRSERLSSLWPFGYASIGEVNFHSAAYVARYCMKKVTGKEADEHYAVVNLSSGEISKRVPEFNRMSLRPGIGAGWFAKFKSDVFPKGLTVVNGVQTRCPKYYDKLMDREDSDVSAVVAYEREKFAQARSADSTDRRLLDRAVVTSARIRSLKRNLE